MSFVAVGIALGTAALGWWNQDQLAKKQDRQAAQQITQSAATQRKADARLAELVQQVGQSNPRDEIAAREQSYLDTLKMGAQRSGINEGPGGFSDAYRADVAADQQAVDQYGTNRAGLMARIDAPTYQRLGEGVLFDRSATDLGMIQRGHQGDQYLSDLKMRSLRTNPWVDALAQAGAGYAQGRAKSGGTTTWDPAMTVVPERIVFAG